jgi:hypothetical protein
MNNKTTYLEILYAQKWQQIWDGDKNADAYKKLEAILQNGVTKLRMDYGRFWKEAKCR